jgi:hypothetical protein
MIIRKATLPKLAEFLKEEDNTVHFPTESLKQKAIKNFRKGVNRHSHKPNFSNQARLQAKLDVEDDYLRMKSTNSIVLPTEDSPEKLSSSPQSCYSQLLNKKSADKEGKSVIKIVEIDKQIYLKQAVKEEIRMFGINNIQARYEAGQSQPRYDYQPQPRYDCQPQITNFGDWKRR